MVTTLDWDTTIADSLCAANKYWATLDNCNKVYFKTNLQSLLSEAFAMVAD